MSVANKIYQNNLIPRSMLKFWVGNILVICLLVICYNQIISQEFIDSDTYVSDSISAQESIVYDTSVNTYDSLIHYDSAYYEVRYFNKLKVEKFRNDKDYAYFKLNREPFNLMDFLFRLFEEYILKPFSRLIGFSGAPYIMLLIILLLVGFIAYTILRKKANTGIDKNLHLSLGYKNSLENIHEINFDSEIENALKLADYSLAVRLHYLKLLKQLFDRGILKYKISKTNTDYLNELRNSELSPSFRRLSDIFNYISYGKFLISSDDYSLIINKFRDFSSRVGRNE